MNYLCHYNASFWICALNLNKMDFCIHNSWPPATITFHLIHCQNSCPVQRCLPGASLKLVKKLKHGCSSWSWNIELIQNQCAIFNNKELEDVYVMYLNCTLLRVSQKKYVSTSHNIISYHSYDYYGVHVHELFCETLTHTFEPASVRYFFNTNG